MSTDLLDFSSQDWVSYIEWFFSQVVGLTGAIETLHHPTADSGESCRHGDLKPENILCFSKHELGTGKVPKDVRLVIADAGHAKAHEKATELRAEKTKTPGGTIMYSAPEAEYKSENPRSRRYDIWSLGCLYLEFLIWILHGNEALDAFRDAVGHGQPYYESNPNAASKVVVKKEVKNCIEIIKADPPCIAKGPTALGRLVDLIEKRLLVVKVETRRNSVTHRNPGPSESTNNSTDTDIPITIVTSATIDSTRPLDAGPERADAKEMYQEMQKIFAAAQGGSIPWINWDGVEEAAKQGAMQITSSLSPQGQHGSVGVGRREESTPVVRHRTVPRFRSPHEFLLTFFYTLQVTEVCSRNDKHSSETT